MRREASRKGDRFIKFLNGRVVVFIMRRVLKKSGHLGKTNGNLIETHGMDAVETPLLVKKFCTPKPIRENVAMVRR